MPQYRTSVSQPLGNAMLPEGHAKKIARARRIIAARARRQLDDGSFRLYCEIEDRAGKSLETYVHQARLAADLRISERTVIRRLKTIAAAGFVAKRRTQSGNRYRMIAVEAFLNDADSVTSQAPPQAPALMEPALKNLGQSEPGPGSGRGLLVEHLKPFARLGIRNRDGSEWNPEETAEALERAGLSVGVGAYAIAAHLYRVYERVVRRPSWWPRSPQWFKATVDQQFGIPKPKTGPEFAKRLVAAGAAKLRTMR